MIDERHEELACLHALDLLEAGESAQFQQELGRNPTLQVLARELHCTGSALAYAASPATPPSALRSRILHTVAARRKPAPIIRPPASVFRTFAPWAIAASLALCAGWFAQLYLSSQSEAELLRSQSELATLSVQATRQQLEAERILARRQVADLEQQKAGAEAQLVEARAKFADRESQIARLATDLKSQVDLANLKVTALASLLNDSPKAQAIAVWNPASQEGLLKVEKLPALTPTQDYQLWVVDPQYPNPVDGGVFTVDPVTGEARLIFHAKQPVASVNAFAVTLERKGGVPKAEGPFVLLGK